MVAYITYKRGGFQAVSNYDAFSYSDQTLYAGYYRNTGWVANILNISAQTTVGPNTGAESILLSTQVPITGTPTVPDEQAHTPPRALSWPETKLAFTLAGRTVAEFYWKDIRSWSTSAPVIL